MNLVDKAISWFDPLAGLRRANARHALELSKRAYEGAKLGRRTDGWITSGTSANAEIAGSLPYLRDRARDLVRNNPYANRALATFDGDAVGTGIIARPRSGDDKSNKTIKTLWDE